MTNCTFPASNSPRHIQRIFLPSQRQIPPQDRPRKCCCSPVGRDGSNLPMRTAALSEATGGLSRARPRCAGALARSGVRCVVAVSAKEMGKEKGFIRRAVSARPEGAAVDPAARGGRVAAGSVCRDFLSQLDPLKHSQVSFLPSLLQTSSLPSPFFL